MLDGDRDGGAVQSVAVPGLPPVVADPGTGDLGEAAVVTPPGELGGHRPSVVRWPVGPVTAVCARCGAGALGSSDAEALAALDETPCSS